MDLYVSIVLPASNYEIEEGMSAAFKRFIDMYHLSLVQTIKTTNGKRYYKFSAPNEYVTAKIKFPHFLSVETDITFDNACLHAILPTKRTVMEGLLGEGNLHIPSVGVSLSEYAYFVLFLSRDEFIKSVRLHMEKGALVLYTGCDYSPIELDDVNIRELCRIVGRLFDITQVELYNGYIFNAHGLTTAQDTYVGTFGIA